MHELTQADKIWNRACLNPVRILPGDRALADLLKAHGLIMNGGVLHAIECLKANELVDAQSGYRYFGFDSVVNLLSRAMSILETGDNLDIHEGQLDQQYACIIPDDGTLVDRFEEWLLSKPSDYAPLGAND
jgi:hypothetical protein